MSLDPRLNAFRPDLADARLEKHVAAERFVDGEAREIVAAATAVRKAPRGDAARLTEALLGEAVNVFERQGDWAWVQLVADGYVGYVEADALGEVGPQATHRIAVPLTHRYPAADLKSEPSWPAYLETRVAVTGEDGPWSRLAGGGHVYSRHLAPLKVHAADFVSVAEGFLGVPYLWGGKTFAGLDCSGLVQVALAAAGAAAPRDTDMQERALGEALAEGTKLKRGDLVFWKGHVGIMLDGARLLHANGHHMQVVIEPLAEARARIAAAGFPVTSIRRLILFARHARP
ncbi:MAG: NlpC/P60 family protein [Parvibaculaceae bacterium]